MSSTILLNNKLKKNWTENKIDSETSQIKENPNLISLKKVGILGINEYCELLVKKMNEKNSKYQISNVEFIDEPVPIIGNNAMNAGIIVKNINNERKPLAYIFVSSPNLGSRNIFGSQQLFPGLSYLVSNYMFSPSYDLANLPIYFINGSTDKITESMQETILAISLMDVRYVQIFEDSPYSNDLSNSDLIGYSKFITNEASHSNDGIIHTDFYELNSNNKTITFTTKSFKNLDSYGSSDRFFVIKAYPALILADKEKYNIDTSEIEFFLNQHNKGKNNLEPFLKYAKKLEERQRL